MSCLSQIFWEWLNANYTGRILSSTVYSKIWFTLQVLLNIILQAAEMPRTSNVVQLSWRDRKHKIGLKKYRYVDTYCDTAHIIKVASLSRAENAIAMKNIVLPDWHRTSATFTESIFPPSKSFKTASMIILSWNCRFSSKLVILSIHSLTFSPWTAQHSSRLRTYNRNDLGCFVNIRFFRILLKFQNIENVSHKI